MEIRVVKRSGESEPFQREKIVKACTGTGAPADVAARIADEIEKSARDQMPTTEIREAVLEKLRSEKPEWETAYLEYEKEKRGG